jgi:molybdate transport system substrate-binding protein
MKTSINRALLTLLLLLVCVVPLHATDILVAAASDLSFAVKEIIGQFEQQTGHKVKLSLGSSGTFQAQISNGAPFDLFLSADIDYAGELEKGGFAEPQSLFVYAVGRTVVWVPKSSRIDVEKLGMRALLDPSIRKIAIANPQHAPYGRAAVSSMQYFKVYEAVKDKFVLGENVSQAAQFVQSGAADAGIIALSLARSDTMQAGGKYWQIPLESYPRMDQGGIILKQARKAGHLEAARAFMDSLRSNQGRAVLERYGFSLPKPGESTR